jgi:hypothetical protein
MGAGRPKTIEHPIKVALWLDRDVFERAKIAAKTKGKTVSELVRESLARLVAGRRPRPRRPKTSRPKDSQ